jgi:hypothetical protein
MVKIANKDRLTKKQIMNVMYKELSEGVLIEALLSKGYIANDRTPGETEEALLEGAAHWLADLYYMNQK